MKVQEEVTSWILSPLLLSWLGALLLSLVVSMSIPLSVSTKGYEPLCQHGGGEIGQKGKYAKSSHRGTAGWASQGCSLKSFGITKFVSVLKKKIPLLKFGRSWSRDV